MSEDNTAKPSSPPPPGSAPPGHNPSDASEIARPFKPWPEQDENGVDLSLIRANLCLTPLERVRKAYQGACSIMRMGSLARRIE